jgi:hypothetical protein
MQSFLFTFCYCLNEGEERGKRTRPRSRCTRPRLIGNVGRGCELRRTYIMRLCAVKSVGTTIVVKLKNFRKPRFRFNTTVTVPTSTYCRLPLAATEKDPKASATVVRVQCADCTSAQPPTSSKTLVLSQYSHETQSRMDQKGVTMPA